MFLLENIKNIAILVIFFISGYFLSVKYFKYVKTQPPTPKKVAVFLELKSAISFYIFFKQQIEFACKSDIMVSNTLLELFKNFLEKKFIVLENLLKKVSKKEKKKFCAWIFSRDMRVFPKELIDLFKKYRFNQPKSLLFLYPSLINNLNNASVQEEKDKKKQKTPLKKSGVKRVCS